NPADRRRYLPLPPLPPSAAGFPYTTLFRSPHRHSRPSSTSSEWPHSPAELVAPRVIRPSSTIAAPTPVPRLTVTRLETYRPRPRERKSARLNSSHVTIAYGAVRSKKKHRSP